MMRSVLVAADAHSPATLKTDHVPLVAVILAAGLAVYLRYRRKFDDMDGFDGFITERRKNPPRNFDWTAEMINAERKYAEK